MSPALRWIAGIVVLAVAVGILSVPDDPQQPRSVAEYLFVGFLLICATACALPSQLGGRVVSGGASFLCFLMIASAIRLMFHERNLLRDLEWLDILIPTAIIGIGIGWHALTGRLPGRLWLLFRTRPPDQD